MDQNYELATSFQEAERSFHVCRSGRGRCDGFVSSQPKREQESHQSPVSFSFEPFAIRRFPKRLPCGSTTNGVQRSNGSRRASRQHIGCGCPVIASERMKCAYS